MVVSAGDHPQDMILSDLEPGERPLGTLRRMSREWMVYGANGYTGELIARAAVARGMVPVLAGRSYAKVEPLATELKLASRIMDLDDSAELDAYLGDVSLVLHCAGP